MKGDRVPTGWFQGQLRDLLFFQRGYDITQAQQADGAVPVISASGVTSYHNEARATGPGVIIGRKGRSGRSTTRKWTTGPTTQRYGSKSLAGNNPRFVYYYLHTVDFKRLDVGNSNPTLNRNHIHCLPAAIPPRVTARIALPLSSSVYDDLIENNRRRLVLRSCLSTGGKV